MRCKTCQYPLWNIPSRTCPECGSPFAPSDFTFKPNTVRFRCPHCAQDYYGTSPEGHLVPNAFDCVNCHNHITMDDTIVLPAEGVNESQTQGQRPLGWTDPNRKSWRYAFYNTLGLSLALPHTLAKRLPEPAKPVAAIGFAAAMTAIPVIITIALAVALIVIVSFTSSPGTGTSFASFSVFGFFLAPTLAVTAAYLFVGAPLQHLALAITGRNKRGFAGTIETAGFSSAPLLLTAIPCLGFYVAPLALLWWGTIQIFLLRFRHDIGWLRASIVGLIPAVIINALIISGIALLFARIPSLPAQNARFNASMQQFNLQDWAASNNGLGPDNALLLLTDGAATEDEFFAENERQNAGTPTFPALNIGPHPFDDTLYLNNTTANAANALLDQSRPPNPAAQRLGDIVFTHFGIAIDPYFLSPNANAVVEVNPGDLWWAIVLPDPASHRPPKPQDAVYIVTSITIDSTTYDQLLATELPAQNALRASFNLPPIPDPAAVPHAHWADGKGNTFGP